jgi:hypothetical protein
MDRDHGSDGGLRNWPKQSEFSASLRNSARPVIGKSGPTPGAVRRTVDVRQTSDGVMSENSIALKTRVLCGRVRGTLCQR